MRVSTASGGEPAYVDYLYDQLPRGLTLNIGAGVAPKSRSRPVIGVDHAESGAFTPWVIADAQDLPFRSHSVDAVLLKDVLEHLQDPIRALAEIGRVLRDTGRAAIVTPRAVPRAVWDDPTHIRGFTSRALRTALQLAGLEALRSPRRVGRLPGAGRYRRLTPLMPMVMRVPLIGHWLGTNWLVLAEPLQDGRKHQSETKGQALA